MAFLLGLMRYEGAPCIPETLSRGTHGVPQIRRNGFSAITWREANPTFVDLDVDTGVSTEIGNATEIEDFRAFTRRLEETEGFEPSIPY